MQQINPQLRIIRDEVLGCTKCSLYKSRTYPVIGQGNHQADIVLVAEAPGANENRSGRPFYGQAGKVLDELLESVNLKREDIYITNILKCRPPGNRNPKLEEIQACTPFLLRQLKIIQPRIVGCLGSFASHFIMEQYSLSDCCAGMNQIHGKSFEVKRPDCTVRIVPLYHPAVASYNSNMIEILKNDFLSLME